MEDSKQGCSDDPAARVFTAAAEQFARLLQIVATVPAGSKDFARDLDRVRESLVAQLGGWLQSAHPFATFWFGTPGLSASVPTAGQGIGTALGPDLPRIQRMLADWERLQTQLAAHWNTIARVACEKFLAQINEPTTTSGRQRDARKLYQQWIDCAEEAYAETAHSEAFCNVISGLINTAAAFQLLGQEQAQAFARAVNLPARPEFDALKREVADLKRQLSRRSRPIRSRKAHRGRKQRR
jgi:polyhydroxyalkanoate synthase subunit PhaE